MLISPHSKGGLRRQIPMALLATLTLASTPFAALCPQQQDQARAQESESDEFFLGETIVTATRTNKAALDTPYSAAAIEAEEIKRRAYRTTPQILRNTPGVLVQETAHGQGSPYIRGFTGYRNLLLIDGIRLNNSVFRSGPNQYWNTLDPLSIERLEVVKGPSSVLYGSDAIGGTVNVLTKNPYSYGEGIQSAANLYYRYSSAEDSNIGRAEVSVSGAETWGVLMGVSRKVLGDLRAGGDTGRQPNTGYDEWDADFKMERFLDEDTRLVFAYQNVRQNDVPRTHRTVDAISFEGTSVGSDLRRDLDQSRELAYLQLHAENQDAFYDSYSLSVSWQSQEEVRHRVRGNGNPGRQGFGVDSFGLFANLASESSLGMLTYGLDAYRDEVDSFRNGQPIQGPVADDASYDLLGVFAQDEIQVNERLSVTLGGRFNYAAAESDSVLDPVTSTRTSIDESWSSFVGSARFLYELVAEKLHLFGGVSQGFRAPNLSDLTRFDSARTNEFEIPALGLDPEKYLNFELGVKSKQQDLSTQASVFYTDVSDQISLFPTGVTNAAGEAEITKDNIGDGYVYGIEVGAALDLDSQWGAFGNAAYFEGKLDTFPTSAPVIEREHIDRLMPLSAQAGVTWESHEKHLWAEALGIYAGDADRLSTRDTRDTSRIPPGGTPSYLVFHLRGGWRLNRNLSLNLALENLFDEDYRVHGSGQNRPGRSLLFGLTYSL